MTNYILTEAKLHRILTKREGEMPGCERCGKPLSEMVGENISSLAGRTKRKFYCEEHDPEKTRI